MRGKRVRNMVLCSLMASFIALCAWLSVPVPPVAVTMQTFAVFLCLGVLGGRLGTAAVGLYLLLGLVGLPVFTGFRGGAAALLDATGGFLWGFLGAGLVYWLTEGLGRLSAMILGMLTCYACGCFWFTIWAPGTGWWGAMAACVLPYLIPDAIKLGLAWRVSGQLKKQWKP